MEIRINEDLAMLHRGIGAFSKAIKITMQIIDKTKQLYDINNYSLVRQYSQLAEYLFLLGEYGKSINYTYEALKIIESKGEKVEGDEANTYVLLAKNNNAIGNKEASFEFAKIASNYFDRPEVSSAKGLAHYYEVIAKVYQNDGNYDRAFEFYSKAYRVYYKELPKDPDIIYVLCDIAKTSAYLGKYELAEKCIQEAKESTIGPGLNWRNYFEIYNSIGEIKIINGELDEALHNYKKAIQLSNEYGYDINHNLIYIYIYILTCQLYTLNLATAFSLRNIK